LIVKPPHPPILLLQTEALCKRLPQTHRLYEKVNDNLKFLRAGYNGEKSLFFTLSLLDNASYRVLHSLRIPDTFGYFQIDNFILTRNFSVISEVKNIYGTVTFDELGQMIRSIKDVEEGFKNPIEQVLKQEFRLKRWLKNNHLPMFPIEKLVVFSNSNTILKNLTNRALSDVVIHEDKLFSRLSSFDLKYPKESLTERQLNRITNKLMDAHTPSRSNILEKYGISKQELLKGVFCAICNQPSMNRLHGKWICSQCGAVSKGGHLSALKDYYLLISNEINNRQARDFLNVTSSDVVKQLLQKEKFVCTGTTSATKYRLEFRDLVYS
jgi:ribosomal protein L37AE/L43A